MRSLAFLKKCNDLLARDARETFHEILDRIAAFEVIDKILDRHPGAGKARCAADDFGINFDD